MRSLTILATSFEGIAKPILSIEASEYEDDIFEELIPITLPYLLMRGPPEFPELIAASVWRRLSDSSFTEIFLSLPETTPVVTVFLRSKPRGLPIAITDSPSWRASLSPNSAAVRSSASILRTARSLLVS